MCPSQHPQKPPYWQLYLGLAVMLPLLFMLVGITPLGWHEAIEIGWCVIAAGGAAGWVSAHADGIAVWAAWQSQVAEEDGTPLTPVQRRYRRAINHRDQKDHR